MGHAEGNLSSVPDPYNLQRFLDALAGVYDEVTGELRDGRKRTHWMWFVFPQLTGLGRTATAEQFGIASLAEAHAYLGHQVLGPRLRECAGLLRDYPGLRPITVILGHTDALKFAVVDDAVRGCRVSRRISGRPAVVPGGAGPLLRREPRRAHPDHAQRGARMSQPCGGTSTWLRTSAGGIAEPASTSAGRPVSSATGRAIGVSSRLRATTRAPCPDWDR